MCSIIADFAQHVGSFTEMGMLGCQIVSTELPKGQSYRALLKTRHFLFAKDKRF